MKKPTRKQILVPFAIVALGGAIWWDDQNPYYFTGPPERQTHPDKKDEKKLPETEVTAVLTADLK